MSHDPRQEFSAAMRAGDFDCGDRLLGNLGPQLPDQLLASIAELHIVRERWDQAIDALSRMKYRDSNAALRLRLSRNMASMQVHRPKVYHALIDAKTDQRYGLTTSRTGHPTIVFQTDRGGQKILSADNDPLASVQRAMTTIDAAYKNGKSLGLAGVGDGYLLGHFARNPPSLSLGREHVVVLIEPDPQLLLACLMIHDYTGRDGPIEQARFSWYVGPRWLENLREEFFADLFLLHPAVIIRSGLQAAAIEAALEQFLKEIAALDAQLAEQVRCHYDRLTREQLLAVLGENPPRPPRALVITTRFSTVLQFSSADTADAFRRLGWDAKLLIEPSVVHGMNRIAMRQALAEFKPDLIFQIDHLRSEYGDLFPAKIPAVCWIQDHLQNLMSASAGASVSSRDFVLSESGQMYQQKFGYPERQCIYLNKATRTPAVPDSWEQSGDELIFVSNCSHDPRELAEKLCGRIDDAAVQKVVRELCDRMLNLYTNGGSIATLVELDAALDAVEKEHNIRAGVGTQRDILIHALWHPFNDTLYRQQALRWAVQAADAAGLTLGLYGNGWEKNPEFFRHARGYAKYGPELEALTRRTRVNLHIVPFSCLHQRLLDGLVCGGFFMIRDHPANHSAAQIQMFLDQHLPADIATTQAVRANLSDNLLAEFEALLARHRRLHSTSDPVARVREAVHRGLTTQLPHLDAISFNTPKEFTSKLAGFLASEHLRKQIAADQRKFVERYFTYESNVKRILGNIHDLIASEPATLAAAA